MLGLETCEKPRDGICRGGAAIWESQVCAAGLASRELCRQLDGAGVMKTDKAEPAEEGTMWDLCHLVLVGILAVGEFLPFSKYMVSTHLSSSVLTRWPWKGLWGEEGGVSGGPAGTVTSHCWLWDWALRWP